MRNLFALSIMLLFSSSTRAAEVVVEDIFGRRLNEHGLILVDWDGQIANPAIKLFIVPPAKCAFPAQAILTSQETQAYFNLPSEIGAQGPRKVIEFTKHEKLPVFVSIFPDRASKDRAFDLQLEIQDAKGRRQVLKLPCQVIDQDQREQKTFPLIVDFSRDRTGFFKDEMKRKVVTQAAQDWAYFFEPAPYAPVPAGNEKTFIWDPDGFKTGRHTVNAQRYTGYLLYAYGIQSDEIRSGGEPSAEGGFQSRNGRALTIRRSGGLEVEIRGNYNTLGWMVSLADGDFWKATNLGEVKNDLYSIAHHEIGHALIFNWANPLFDQAKKTGVEKPKKKTEKKGKAMGKFEDPDISAYFGADLPISKQEHLTGAVDPASRRGAFGNEYNGEMPRCRWQITKLDLLCAKAVGWPLRETSAFAPLGLQAERLPAGAVGKKYEEKLQATGGIPFYNWEVTAGPLPAGLKLNSFNGAISGTPVGAGDFEFTIRVRDYEEQAPGLSRTLRLEIKPG